MTMYDIFQYAIIAAVVVFSLHFMLRKFGILKPAKGKPTRGRSCGDGCGTCNGCSAVSALKSQLPKS